MHVRVAVAAWVLLALAVPATVSAQQRPFVTEDPEPVGGGVMLIEAGFDYALKQQFPVSGLTGNLVRGPLLGLSFGLSDIAELQVDGLSFSRHRVTAREPGPLSSHLDFSGDTTSSIADLVIATKVRLIDEGSAAPGFGLHLATKLPNASNEAGLGTDAMDFYASLLVGKTMDTVRVVGNAGFGILGDPTRGDRQNDVMTYGVSIARAMTHTTEVVAELAGRLNTRTENVPVGTESSQIARIGARATWGAMRLDGAAVVGLRPTDPDFGFTAGFTWAFRAFNAP